MITPATLKLLIQIHKSEPIRGKLLCLGRQNVSLDKASLESIFKESGVEVHPSFYEKIEETDAGDNKCPSMSGCLTDHQLFSAFGEVTVDSMDFSDYEGASIVHDLNEAIPESLHGKFDFIVDGGTFDHLVDIKTAFQNLVRLLSDDGRTFMWNAASNFNFLVYHSFSPDFFNDYFTVNNFAFCKTCIAEVNTPCQQKDWDLFQFDGRGSPLGIVASYRPQMVLVYAKKQPCSTFDKMPIQEVYRREPLKRTEDKEFFDPFFGNQKKKSFADWKSRIKALYRAIKKERAIWKGRV